MFEVLLFLEDSAQEKFLTALIHRMSGAVGLKMSVRIRSAKGGFGKVLGQIEDFVADQENGRAELPDALIVAVDANCKGFVERRRQAEVKAGKLKDFVIYAIPDPHIERWFLIDGSAFKDAVGHGCNAPDTKCEKERYKKLLNQAIVDAGVQPLLGGVEYAEDIVAALDIQRACQQDDSFRRFVSEFRRWLNQMKQR